MKNLTELVLEKLRISKHIDTSNDTTRIISDDVIETPYAEFCRWYTGYINMNAYELSEDEFRLSDFDEAILDNNDKYFRNYHEAYDFYETYKYDICEITISGSDNNYINIIKLYNEKPLICQCWQNYIEYAKEKGLLK